MILYFSATGNCKYVAQRLAQVHPQEILPIVDCIKNHKFDFEDEAIGIISPTYFWGLPSIVEEFLKKAAFKTDYLYFVSTYGTTTGAAGRFAANAIHGRKIDAFYAVRMPDTWTPMFDLSSSEKIAKFTKTTEKSIDAIINKVAERYTNRHISPRTPAFLAKWVAQPIYHHQIRRTAHFYAENSCIGCGLCEKQCPVHAIQIENGKPVWVKTQCVMCLGCLHHCPKFAIQYGNRTRKHGQYVNPNVRR